MRPYRRFIASSLLTVFAINAAAANPCEQAGTDAEKTHNLPPGLLLAIGRVESGRWDAATQERAAWPWTIDVAGDGRQFTGLDEAVRETAALRAEGTENIDVGCFQISLLHHPDAFTDLRQAFDPAANAAYAARFLMTLKERLGSWTAAVAAYHSSDPRLGTPYQQRVFANWNGSPDAVYASDPEPVLPFGIHIWTPSAPGTAPVVVRMGAPGGGASVPLPRLVTPGG